MPVVKDEKGPEGFGAVDLCGLMLVEPLLECRAVELTGLPEGTFVNDGFQARAQRAFEPAGEGDGEAFLLAMHDVGGEKLPGDLFEQELRGAPAEFYAGRQ